MVHLITGYAGYEHIQSEDDGAFNAAFFGNGQYVMETGNQFEGSIINNNTVRILDGDGLMYGRHFRIKPNTYEDLNITTGTAGTRRVDMICMTYEKNAGDGTEQVYLQVVKGAETSGTPAAPSYTDGNILDGATFNQMPLYKVEIEGVVLSSITALFDTIPTYKALAETYEAKFKAACQSHLDSLGVLDTMEEITANTQSNQLAGALGVKQIYNQLNTDKQNDLGLSGVAIEKTPAFRVDTANSNVAFTVTAKNNIKAIMGVTMAAYSSNNYTSNISYSFSGKDITFVVCASVAQNYEITFTYLY